MTTLKQPLPAILIHGVTGQALEHTILEPGQEVTPERAPFTVTNPGTGDATSGHDDRLQLLLVRSGASWYRYEVRAAEYEAATANDPRETTTEALAENERLRSAARHAVKTGDAWMRCLDEFANEPGGIQTCSEWADAHDAALAALAKLIDYERL